MKTFLFAILVILPILISSPTAAQVEARFLGGPDTDLAVLPVPAPSADCRIGNLRAPGGLLAATWLDVGALAVDLDPAACGCAVGWASLEVHLLVMNDSDGALSGNVHIAIDGQGPPPDPIDPGCPVPNSGYFGDMADLTAETTLPFPGVYELVCDLGSPCAYFGHAYFIKLQPLMSGDLRLVIDDEPRVCDFYYGYNIAERWYWSEFAGEGAPLWWIEAECCSPAIPVKGGTWGALKATYR